MATDIVFTSMPAKDLQEMISLAVRNEFADLAKNEKPAPTVEYLTRKQTAAKLQVSLVTLHEWTKTGILQGYRIAGRVRYKSDELEAALQAMQTQKNKVITGE